MNRNKNSIPFFFIVIGIILLISVLWRFKLSAQEEATSPTIELVFVEGNAVPSSPRRENTPAQDRWINSFMIGKFEINQYQWLWVMYSVNPSQFKGFDLPVENVSWYDAILFCNSLSHMQSLDPFYNIDGLHVTRNVNATGYRLPTEAEWVYAARGGRKSRDYLYSGSDSVNEVAWYAGNSENRSHNTGQKKPNELGIYDFSGNVSEWCWDIDHHAEIKPSTGIKPLTDGRMRITRGSSWQCLPDSLQITHRNHFHPLESSGTLGFRVCRSLSP